jgi:hypothetical protein
MTIDDAAIHRPARTRDPVGRRLLLRTANAMSRLATWPLLLGSTAVFVVSAGVFFASAAPFAVPQVESACHQAPPDMRFTSSAAEIIGFLRACGTNGRDAYQYLQIADLLYPTVFGIFIATAIAFVLARLAPARHTILALAAVPLIASAFDYLENLCAWLALAAYPAPASTSALMGLASAAKNVASWTAGVVLVGALGMLAIKSLRRISRGPSRRGAQFRSPGMNH